MASPSVGIKGSPIVGVRRPIILGIVGDSAAGKTTLSRGIAQISVVENVAVLCTDDYHRYNRKQRKELNITPLSPECNYLDIMAQHLRLLRAGEAILKPHYDHKSGDFGPPQYIVPHAFLIVEGLLGMFWQEMRKRLQCTRLSRSARGIEVALENSA